MCAATSVQLAKMNTILPEDISLYRPLSALKINTLSSIKETL